MNQKYLEYIIFRVIISCLKREAFFYFTNFYFAYLGLTDAGGLCVSQTRTSKPGSCGFVTRGVRIKVVDEKTGETLGVNKIGELCIKSEFVMNGYHKNPQQTKEAIDSDGQ